MIKKASCQHQWKSSSGLLKKTRQNSIPVSLKVSYTTASITPYRLTTKHDLRLCLLGFLLYKHETNILKNPDFVRVFFFFFLQMDFNSTLGKEQYAFAATTNYLLAELCKKESCHPDNDSMQQLQPASCTAMFLYETRCKFTSIIVHTKHY